MGYSTPVSTYDVILPAGGRIDEAFAKEVGTDVKALIRFDGQTILDRTLEALKASGRVKDTVVIGPAQVREAAAGKATHSIEEGATGPENIFRGLETVARNNPEATKVLLVTTDLPFLTPEIINRFLDACPPDVEIAVPLVRQSEYESRFPGSTATFVRLRDDSWTTGCAYVMDVKAMARIRPSIERVFEQRKSKVGMAKLLGPMFVAKFLAKRITLADVEGKIESLLGCSGKAIMGAPPELAYDIDYIDDYQYAVERMA
jgi:GTP:adenosylcobinamide-phosphate guanylyltransferase